MLSTLLTFIPSSKEYYVSGATISEPATIIKEETIKERLIREFGVDSIMIKIAWCESRYNQFNPDGSVHRGIINSHDVGIFQINETYHLQDSKRMGINIYTVEGNIAYARYLYKNQGTRPWNWSKETCWDKS